MPAAPTPSRTPSTAVVVTPDVRNFFTEAEITGQGGFQSLCRLLAERLARTSVLRLDRDEFVRVARYANNYGDGGFQTRLRRILASWVAQHAKEIV